MPRNQIINGPLSLALTIAFGLHVVALLAFGSIAIWQYTQPPEADFEPPPPVKAERPPPPPRVVQVAQKQQISARPTRKLTVKNVNFNSMPTGNIDLPTVDLAVATPGVGSSGSIANNFGRGDISLDKMAVDFFSIKSKGERLVFLVDTSDDMMEDKKGGMNAYRIIKEEITTMIEQLPPGTLFNVILFSGRKVEPFQSSLVRATSENKQQLRAFLSPVNEDPNNRGNKDSYKVQTPVTGLGDYLSSNPAAISIWKAVHVAFEMNADAIFIISDGLAKHQYSISEGMKPDEKRAYLANKMDWNDAKQEAWDQARQKAEAWVERESEARKKKGLPPKVGANEWIIAQEKFGGQPPPDVPPKQRWEQEDIIQHLRQLAVELKKEERNPRMPEFNYVAFLGPEEDWKPENDEMLQQFVRRFNGDYRVLNGLPALQNVTQAAD